LSAIRSFCRFAALSEPDQSDQLEEIIAIPSKECTRHEINFLTRQEVDALLAATKRITWFDRRDQALITVAVDTGMLVSELTALQPQDVDIENAQVRIVGRRRKERHMPLNKGTLAVLKSWLQEPAKSQRKILFQNPSGRRLTSDGVRYILNKHLTAASEICPSLLDKQVTLYWLRHTKALELLQAGVKRSQVALWMGMESAVFTSIYDNEHLAWRKLSANAEQRPKAKT
jgi:site-specific recombinase XerD